MLNNYTGPSCCLRKWIKYKQMQTKMLMPRARGTNAAFQCKESPEIPRIKKIQ